MMELQIVVCSNASEYLVPGNVTGYKCAVCNEALQAPPEAVALISSGGVPFCVPCSFALHSLLEKKPSVLIGVVQNHIAERMRRAQNN